MPQSPLRKVALACAAAACAWASVLASQPPESVQVSSYAPVDDVLRQVDFFITRVEDSLSDPDKFDAAKQSRTFKDANTLAVFALVLAKHDQPHAVRKSMPAMLAAAQALAAAEDDAARAQEALAGIKQARAGMVPGGGEPEWEQVASLPALMKQVPLVHASLKRGATAARLARTAEQSAGQAAALAAIAQASAFDAEYATTPEEAAEWAALCIEMRDAAGEVNSAVHALDAEGVAAGMKRMQQSCDACHAKFRDH